MHAELTGNIKVNKVKKVSSTASSQEKPIAKMTGKLDRRFGLGGRKDRIAAIWIINENAPKLDPERNYKLVEFCDICAERYGGSRSHFQRLVRQNPTIKGIISTFRTPPSEGGRPRYVLQREFIEWFNSLEPEFKSGFPADFVFHKKAIDDRHEAEILQARLDMQRKRKAKVVK